MKIGPAPVAHLSPLSAKDAPPPSTAPRNEGPPGKYAPWPWWYDYVPGTWDGSTQTFTPANPNHSSLIALDKAPEGFYNNPEQFLN